MARCLQVRLQTPDGKGLARLIVPLQETRNRRMKRIMTVLVLVLALVAGLELSGCKKPSGAKKSQPAKEVKKTAATRPATSLDSLLEQQDYE